MANNCFYTIHAVSDKKENLERLIKIMNYNDNEYFIYRCFNCDVDGKIEKDGKLYTVILCGDVAWAADKWFSCEENKELLVCTGYKEVDGKQDLTQPIYGTAHYVTLDILCEKLNIGIELFSEEGGVGFQEHIICNHKGEILLNDSVNWSQEWFDENDNELDEPNEEGGYGDDYCVFCSSEEIYGED